MASKITNTVDFKIDRKSFNAAKKTIGDLQKYANNIKLGGGALDEFNRRAAKAAKEAARARAQANRSQGNANRSQNAAQRKAERERLAAIKRAETAELRRNSVAHQLRQIQGLNVQESLKMARLAAKLTQEYQDGTISARRMNQTLNQQLQITRRIAQERRRANGSGSGAGGAGGSGSGGMSGAGGFGAGFLARGIPYGTLAAGAGAAAVVGGVAKGIGVANDNVTENFATVQQAKNVGIDPNTLLAMVQWGQQHGVDGANRDAIVNNVKDTNERLGEAINPATRADWNAKKGEYTGGNSAITEIMNSLNLSQSDVDSFRGRGLDFSQAVVDRGRAQGLDDTTIKHLLENLGNDMYFYTDALKDNGKGVKDTFKQLQDAGAALTPEFIEMVQKGQDFKNTLDIGEKAMSNSFTAGLLQSVGGLDNFKDILKAVNPIAKWFGEELGDLIKNILGLVQSVISVYNKVANFVGADPIPMPTVPDKPNAPGATPASTNPSSASTASTTTTDNAPAKNKTVGDTISDYFAGFGARFHQANDDLFHPFRDRSKDATTNAASIASSSVKPDGTLATPTAPNAGGASTTVVNPVVKVDVQITPDTDGMNRLIKAKTTQVVDNNNNRQALNTVR